MGRTEERPAAYGEVPGGGEARGGLFQQLPGSFFAQREYDQARMSFDKYLDEVPEGEFAYTAYDMAEAIDDGTAQAYQDGPFAVPGYTEAEQAGGSWRRRTLKGR